MKSKFHLIIATVIAATMLHSEKTNAQNWLTTGNSGITNSDFIGTVNNADLIFKTKNIEGGRLLKTREWRLGTPANFARIDSTGKLSFGGTGAYYVAANKYVFQYAANTNYGLYFNSTTPQYEFRNGSAIPVFYVNANTGNAIFNGTLKVGAYTLPATDGLNGQLLKTNGAGVLTWSNDNNSGGSGANTSLSNLTATGINQSLLPATDNAINLGSSSKGWRNIYFDSILFIKGVLALHASGSNNFFAGLSAGNNTSLTGSANTGIGNAALLSNTTGSYNTAIGTGALLGNTTGFYNTATGYSSLSYNYGYSNTANGYSSLYANTSGGDNTANGVRAMFSNTTGSYNTSSGRLSMFSNTAGASNTAIGANALYSNTTGYSNIAIGVASLYRNTNKSNLVAIGDSSLYNNGVGAVNSPEATNNTAVGSKSLYSNTTGYSNSATGSNTLYSNITGYSNTANGIAALYSNTSGYRNVANGAVALYSNTTGFYNTGCGFNSLTSNTTGHSNTAVGVASLFSNTIKSNLVAVGDSALYNNGIGASLSYQAIGNTAVGSKSLYSNTTGDANTANGFQALYFNTTGFSNTANGSYALYSNITGSNNTANGNKALYSNTYSISNTANGSSALYSNTTGSNNTANGSSALYYNTTSSNNTANGSSALYYNTTGSGNTANGSSALYSNNTGSYNTANGSAALSGNTSGVYNTADGFNSLLSNTTGYNNTANGVNALYANTDGYSNTASGVNALYNNTTGDANVAVGLQADVTTSNLSYATVIGAGAVVDASYKVRIGNTDITSIGGQVSWTTFSDGRYKKNIKENVPGLAFINSLRPITYTVDMKGLNEYYNKGRKHVTENEDENNAEKAKAADRSSKIVYDGFIAQEVEEAAKKLNFEFSGVDKPQSKDAVYGLRYDNFVVPLVKAVQELSKINNDKTTEIDELKKQNNAQQKQIDELQAMMQLLQQNFEKCNPCSQQPGIGNQQSTSGISAASLEQNIPNPFNHTTTINYTLPAIYTTAKIIITNEAGQVLKEINVSGSGKGSVQINASMFAAGVYNYSLYINSRLIETKKMIK